MCHENKMGAAKNSTHIEQYKLSKDSGTAVEQGTVTRPLFTIHFIPRLDDAVNHHSPATSSVPQELSCVQSVPEPCVPFGS